MRGERGTTGIFREAGQMSTQERRIGIVTTLKGAEHTLESWILFHLAIGINKLYLFFDEPKDNAIRIAQKYDPSVVRASRDTTICV
jgi:hypothetical protein